MVDELLTIGELKKVIKDIPDTVECTIAENRWDEMDNDFIDMRESPIHTVTYHENSGLVTFRTCYCKTGQLGLDEYL